MCAGHHRRFYQALKKGTIQAMQYGKVVQQSGATQEAIQMLLNVPMRCDNMSWGRGRQGQGDGVSGKCCALSSPCGHKPRAQHFPKPRTTGSQFLKNSVASQDRIRSEFVIDWCPRCFSFCYIESTFGAVAYNVAI